MIAFPSSIGVTGLVFNGRTTYFNNCPKKDAKWNPDIDNLSPVTNVRNFMIGALLNAHEQPVGVV